MINKLPVMRLCIACRKTYDRRNLLKITKDYQQGILFHKGIGRSAYICKSEKCYRDSKIKKKLQIQHTMKFPRKIKNHENTLKLIKNK